MMLDLSDYRRHLGEGGAIVSSSPLRAGASRGGNIASGRRRDNDVKPERYVEGAPEGQGFDALGRRGRRS